MFLLANTSLWTNVQPENADFLHKNITYLSCNEGRGVGLPEGNQSGPPVAPTQALGQEVLDELGVISHVQHAVDAGVHQVLLLVPQILADVF